MSKSTIQGLLGMILFIGQIVLGICIVGAIILGIGSISQFLKDIQLFLLWLFGIVYLSMYFIIIRKLMQVLKSTDESPFIIENVKRFKTIGYCMLVNSAYEGITSYVGGLSSNVQIFATSYGAITPQLIIYIVVMLMSFVIAEIFSKAIKIKNENDLTI